MTAAIAYINLEHRVDRREHMELMLKGCPFPWSRINATRFTYASAELEKKLEKKVPTNVAVASIWESHRRAIESLLEANAEYGLVLEDDLHIPVGGSTVDEKNDQERANFWHGLLNCLDEINSDWDLTLISPRYRPKRIVNGELSPFVPPPNGSGPNELTAIRSTHFITGAHLCIYRGKSGLLKALDELKKASIIYDVDRFLVDHLTAFGIFLPGVYGGGLGSDHLASEELKMAVTALETDSNSVLNPPRVGVRPLAEIGLDGSCYENIGNGHNVDLQGWGSDHPIFEEVFKRHRPKMVAEIGTWKGASVLHMHAIAKKYGLQTHFVCIDTWLGSNDTLWLRPDLRRHLNLSNGYPNMFSQFLFNVVASNAQSDISPFPITSTAAARVLKKLGLKFDALYIDAGHEEEEVYFDLALFFDLVVDGGAIFGDDYGPGWPGVVKAVDRFCLENRITPWTGGGKFYFSKPSTRLVAPVAAEMTSSAEGARAQQNGTEESKVSSPTGSQVNGRAEALRFKLPAQAEVVTALVRGRKVRFLVTDPQDHIQRHHSEGEFYEANELKIIERHFKCDTTFLDIGSNIGNHTLFVALFLSPAKIICIEPNPVAATILRANLILNSAEDRVDLTRLGVGLSDGDGLAVLETTKGNLGLTKLKASPEVGGVRVSTGDNVLRGEIVNFVKIDVEGMEVEVLRGLSRTISASRPTIFIEVTNRNMPDIQEWIKANRYEVAEEYVRYSNMRNLLLTPVSATVGEAS